MHSAIRHRRCGRGRQLAQGGGALPARVPPETRCDRRTCCRSGGGGFGGPWRFGWCAHPLLLCLVSPVLLRRRLSPEARSCSTAFLPILLHSDLQARSGAEELCRMLYKACPAAQSGRRRSGRRLMPFRLKRARMRSGHASRTPTTTSRPRRTAQGLAPDQTLTLALALARALAPAQTPTRQPGRLVMATLPPAARAELAQSVLTQLPCGRRPWHPAAALPSSTAARLPGGSLSLSAQAWSGQWAAGRRAAGGRPRRPVLLARHRQG